MQRSEYASCTRAAFAMGFANLAAFEHPAQVGGGLDLSGMRTCSVNTLVEGDIGASQRVESHRTDHVGGIDQDFRRKQREGSDREHGLRAVDQRNSFFGFENQRLDPALRFNASAAGMRLPLAPDTRLHRSTRAQDELEVRDRRWRQRCPATERTASRRD